ncbi:autotransporter-associated beta strand repeat-containing protein, partial [bacterium]|nr:autotransporter-associated beta strand repeat-containing protein [bacterium]
MKPIRCLLFPLLTSLAAAQIPAFPGAQGFGAYATGGRGGDVYYVTNLNNNGAGSLRSGLDTAPAAGRTIVFAVSGYIPVVSDTNFNIPSKVTIAGQTAPGDGVGLRGGRMLISGSNVVMRHFRIRHGKNGTGGDCLNIASTASSTMLDHISMMFSTDENFSFFNSSVNNFTLQYSNTSWGMERHNAGGLWDLQNGSCHHTLWAHHRTRNPKARPSMLEWINNVTFHWRNEPFIMGDSQTPASWKANVRGCYYISIADPDEGYGLKTSGLVKAQVASNGVPNFSLYLDDTLFDNNGNGLVDGTNRGYGIVSGSEFTPGDAVGANRYYKSATPFAGATGSSLVTLDDPTTAYKKVISSGSPLRLDANYAGSLRDELDSLLTDSVVKQYSVLVQKDGKVAGEDPARPSNGEQHLADAYGITNNGFGTLNGTTPPTDVDLDGMPDSWEITLNGLNGMAFNVAADDHNTVFTAGQLPNTFFPAATPAGYTYLEEYLHFLAVPHATVVKNTSLAPSTQTIDLRKYTDGFATAPAFTVAGAVNGTTQQFLANGTTPSASGPIVKFTPTLNATGRAGFNFRVVDAAGSSWTQQFALLISAIAAPRDLVWIGDASANLWDGSVANWKQPSGAATTFGVGDTALFDDRGSASPVVNVTAAQTPGSVLVTGSKNYTLGGSAAIASTGSLTKAGGTTLTLATSTSFAAGTFLNGGSINLSNNTSLGGGTVRFSGGATLNVNYNSSSYFGLNPNVQVDAGSTGNINLSQRSELNGSLSGGGTFNIFSPSNLGTEGRVYFDGASAGCTGQVNLSGGATSPGNGGRMAFRANGGSFNGFGSAKVNLAGLDLFTTNNSGGNIYALGELSGDANSRLRSNYLAGGGATTWSIGSLNTSTQFAGVIMDGIVGISNLTKTGTGGLTLSGASTHTGTTTVSAGTLALEGGLSASPVTVASGATLVGTGSFGGLVTVNSGGKINPGNASSPYRALPANGGLTVAGGTLVYDLSSTNYDRITVATGTATNLSGTVNFQLNFTDGSIGAGTYNLIDGGATQSVSGLTMVPVIPAPIGTTRQTFGLSRSASGATPGFVNLTVSGNAGNLTWTGANGGIWDLNTTVGNWSGATPNTFSNLDQVTFADGATSGTVSLSGTLQPSRITATNGSLAYTLSGTGNLAGAAQLLKSGGGTLTISNSGANTFTGGTTLTSGILSLTNTTSPLGSGVVVLNGGRLSLNATSLSNSMVFAGSSAIASTGGNSALLDSTTGSLSSSGSATVDLSGIAGILSINGPMSGFSGTLAFGTGSGMLRLSAGSTAANFGSAATHFDLGTGSAFLNNRNGGITIRLGAVSGGPNTHLYGRQSGSDATVTTYIVGELNTSTTFSGILSNAGDLSGLNLVKAGSGTWTLAGNSSFIGSFDVAAGTLAITGSTASSNDTTVATGATLSLAGGTFGAESVNNAGTVSGYGTLAADLNSEGTFTGRGFASGTPGTLSVS